jgi:hypothetical protein
MSHGKLEEIIAYNELSDVIECQHEAELHSPDSASWAFKEITEHQGPLTPSDRRYKGSSYNVLVHWEGGSETFDPLSVMAKEDPITCAKYAKDNDLLDKLGWKSLQHIASRTLKFARMCRQAKLQTERRGPTYKFGILLPTDRNHALRINKDNDDHLWETSLGTEMDQPNTTPFAIWGEVQNLHVIINASVFTSSSMSSMTSAASLVLLLVAT